MLLGTGFEFLFRIRRVLRDAKDRIYICSVSPCEDVYRILSVNFYNKIATMSIIVVLGWLRVYVCASSIAICDAVLKDVVSYVFAIIVTITVYV